MTAATRASRGPGSAGARRLAGLGPAQPVLAALDLPLRQSGSSRLLSGLADVLDALGTHASHQLRHTESKLPTRHPARVATLLPQLQGDPQVAQALVRPAVLHMEEA